MTEKVILTLPGKLSDKNLETARSVIKTLSQHFGQTTLSSTFTTTTSTVPNSTTTTTTSVTDTDQLSTFKLIANLTINHTSQTLMNTWYSSVASTSSMQSLYSTNNRSSFFTKNRPSTNTYTTDPWCIPIISSLLFLLITISLISFIHNRKKKHERYLVTTSSKISYLLVNIDLFLCVYFIESPLINVHSHLNHSDDNKQFGGVKLAISSFFSRR